MEKKLDNQANGSSKMDDDCDEEDSILSYKNIRVKSAVPKCRQNLLKWDGWGYRDSGFFWRDGKVLFVGRRYPIGELELPLLASWASFTFNLDLSRPPENTKSSPKEYPKSIISESILKTFDAMNVEYSIAGMDRLIRAHGQALGEIYALRTGQWNRIPDVVVFPKDHSQVVELVKVANEQNLVILPYGGGTSVSGAASCPPMEARPIVLLDTSQMNKILWVDKSNLVACCESGILGQDLERELRKLKLTTGHEPDSYEFSSLGGWVATRASGMKKNLYGNIEDLLVHVRMVTSVGVLERGFNCQVPRISCGPSFDHMILGSEGCLGVVTEVVLKIRPLPRIRRFGSVIFHTFEEGVSCMRQVALHRCQPASIRLMDNDQFRFGHILKPQSTGWGEYLWDNVKKLYVFHWKGFDVEQMCAMTLLFEADNESELKSQESRVYSIARTFNGLPAGAENGERGYTLTFVIAYVRDLALDYYVVAESFETSVPWDRVLGMCTCVKSCVASSCKRANIQYFMFNCRVTQTYDSGCVVYFYFAFNYQHIEGDPVAIHHAIESDARNEILRCGGSISHHHGVGKLRSKWYGRAVSDVGVQMFQAAKKQLDPNNVFATNNLVTVQPAKL